MTARDYYARLEREALKAHQQLSAEEWAALCEMMAERWAIRSEEEWHRVVFFPRGAG